MKKIYETIIYCIAFGAVIILSSYSIWVIKNNPYLNNLLSGAGGSGLYSKQTNGIDNIKLADIAVQYIKTAATATFDGVDIKTNDPELVKIDFNAYWFFKHEPDGITYNYNSNGLYDVYWRFMPGCEKKWAEKAGESLWYKPDGIQCLGGWTVEVLIGKDLNIQKISIGTLK